MSGPRVKKHEDRLTEKREHTSHNLLTFHHFLSSGEVHMAGFDLLMAGLVALLCLPTSSSPTLLLVRTFPSEVPGLAAVVAGVAPDIGSLPVAAVAAEVKAQEHRMPPAAAVAGDGPIAVGPGLVGTADQKESCTPGVISGEAHLRYYS